MGCDSGPTRAVSLPGHTCSRLGLSWLHRSPQASGSQATMKHRQRRWGAPTSPAPIRLHSASYPRAARSPRTRPSPRIVSAEEFSTMTNRGRNSRRILAYSAHSPDCSPSMPAPLPAGDMSWQGNPPQIRSTLARLDAPASRTSVTERSALGQCLARFARARASVSTCQSVRPLSACSKPYSRPPQPPLNSEPIVIM